MLEQLFLLNDKNLKTPQFLHVLRYTTRTKQEANLLSGSIEGLKKKIEIHTQLLKDNMRVYNISDIAFKSYEINNNVNKLPFEITFQVNNSLIAMEHKIKSNNKISKKVLEGKISSLQQGLTLIINGIEHNVNTSMNELKNNFELKHNLLENKFDKLQEKMIGIESKIDRILNKL
jgi:hypothetical protein